MRRASSGVATSSDSCCPLDPTLHVPSELTPQHQDFGFERPSRLGRKHGQADEVSEKSENDLNKGDHTVIMPQLRVTELRIAADPIIAEDREVDNAYEMLRLGFCNDVIRRQNRTLGFARGCGVAPTRKYSSASGLLVVLQAFQRCSYTARLRYWLGSLAQGRAADI